MTRLLSLPVTYIVAALFLLATFLLFLALLHLRQARRGPYWRIRKAAGQRGGQLFLISVTLYGLMAAVIFFTGFGTLLTREINQLLAGTPEDFLPGIALPSRTPTPNFPTPDVEGTVAALLTASAQPGQSPGTALPEQPPEASAEARPTQADSPTPTVPPTASATGTPTRTPTQTPTPTPTFDFVLSFTPPPSRLQPERGTTLAIVTVASDVDAEGSPLDSGASFAAGLPRLYVFVAYEAMRNGMVWSRVLYREGVPVQGGDYIWTQGESGSSYFFFGREGGYPAGNYEIRLFLGADEVSRFAFEIGAPAS